MPRPERPSYAPLRTAKLDTLVSHLKRTPGVTRVQVVHYSTGPGRGPRYRLRWRLTHRGQVFTLAVPNVDTATTRTVDAINARARARLARDADDDRRAT